MRAAFLRFVALAGVGLAVLPSPAQTTLIATGSVWKYFTPGFAPGAGWQGVAFDDSAWSSGPAQLGYGDGDERTAIAPVPGQPATLFFRHTFTNVSPGFFFSMRLRLLRDDGAIVYLNTNEVFRNNLPDGAVSPGTPALANNETQENAFFQSGVWPYYVRQGPNTVAVEVHQATTGAHDASFDLELVANLPLTPPTVDLTSPANGSVFGSGAVPLSAAASDLDGHVSLVEFLADGALIGSASAEPFNLLWTPAPGRYALRAHAIDNSGRTGDSPLVYVQVGDSGPLVLKRGPYLQTGTPTSVIVRWRTDWFADSRVVYGTDPANLHLAAFDAELTTEHTIRLTGLSPDTTYYYAAGSTAGLLAGGPDFSFVTTPTNARATRVWVIGDSGTAGFSAQAVRDSFRDYAAGRRADLWLLLGDNAYEGGTDDQYQAALFEMYPAMLRRTVVWPTLGNHDAAYPDANGRVAYHDIFSLPAQGEAGGLASGTKNYYSFDYANIHFVCLDGSLSDRSPDGSMLRWLKSDLAATSQDWIIAFWHQPPYTFGTHNSDSEPDLIQMRENALPILEAYGVDLVLCGHSHVYERSFLLNGHYGNSSTLTPSMILDPGNGLLGSDGAYTKPAGGLGADLGTVYVVCGCSGEGGYFNFARHPAMASNMGAFGSVVLDIDGLNLSAKFLQETGVIGDCFTISKGPAGPGVRPKLEIARAGAQARVSWPTSLNSYLLEAAPGVGPDDIWGTATNLPVQIGRRTVVTFDMENSNRMFRLRTAP